MKKVLFLSLLCLFALFGCGGKTTEQIRWQPTSKLQSPYVVPQMFTVESKREYDTNESLSKFGREYSYEYTVYMNGDWRKKYTLFTSGNFVLGSEIEIKFLDTGSVTDNCNIGNTSGAIFR